MDVVVWFEPDFFPIHSYSSNQASVNVSVCESHFFLQLLLSFDFDSDSLGEDSTSAIGSMFCVDARNKISLLLRNNGQLGTNLLFFNEKKTTKIIFLPKQ